MDTFRTFEEWMRAEYDDGELRDIAEHGASAGWHGMIYYTETSALYERFADDVWAAVRDGADDYGHRSAVAFIADMHGADAVDGDATFRNLLVWYTAERTAAMLSPEE